MKGTKEILAFIQNWIYSSCELGDLKVFIGIEAQCDEKRKLYSEGHLDGKFVAESVPGLADARPGDLYRFIAREEQDLQYGYQWRISSAERLESAAIHVIKKFMAELGERSLTPKRREALINAYGEKVLDAILADPSAFDVINADSVCKSRIYRAIADKRGFADLLSFLVKRGWDCRWAPKLYEKYKDNAIFKILTDPYLLYQHDLTSFRTADQVFLDAGGTVNAPLRCWRAVMAALREEEKQNGGALIPRKDLRGRIAPMLGDAVPNARASNCTISEDDISKALDWLAECRWIHTDRVSGKEDIYFLPLYYAEAGVAKCLRTLCRAEKRAVCQVSAIDAFLAEYRTSGGQQLTPTQCLAVKQMLTSSVSIVTGGPGTGKTLIIQAAIDALHKLCPGTIVQCCAPTGKAADRMLAEACTIDSLIQNEKWKRVYRTGKDSPDIIFVDEVSMVGIELFAKLLAVIPAGARLVLIGDQNQLPSIQAGQVLRDLIDSGVIQTVHLKDVFRQKENSAILTNSEKIIQTSADQDIHLDEIGAGFAFNKHLSNFHRIPGAVVKAIELVQKSGIPLKETQLIIRQKHGELGARNLNHILQDHFNPQKEENRHYYGGKEFRLNDRVIHIKNNYDKNVFNGEAGKITEIRKTREWALTVQYPAKTVRYSEKDLAELELVYALTAHKCQGSEYKAVIIPVAGKGISRRWLYTAETRGRQLVLLIGTEDALSAEMRGETTDKRASHLALRLRKLLPPVLPEVEQLSMFQTVEN